MMNDAELSQYVSETSHAQEADTFLPVMVIPDWQDACDVWLALAHYEDWLREGGSINRAQDIARLRVIALKEMLDDIEG